MIKISMVIAVVLLVGCASNPDKIDAAYVSPLKYRNYDCDQIAMEMSHMEDRTIKLYNRLSETRKADNWQMGVGLILFWPSLFLLEGGDGPEAAEYAQLKGNYEALRTTSVQKKCAISFRSPDDIIKEAEKKAKAKDKAKKKDNNDANDDF